jgi:GMP synthase-like glutamine amidotransferase
VKRIYDEYPDKKIIGICFGHQILARALGGKVTVNPRGWEIAVRPVNMADSAKGIFDLNSSVMVFRLLQDRTNGSDLSKCTLIW